MAAARYDLSIEQGSTFRLVLRLPGLDLSGCTAALHIRVDAGVPGPPLYELTTGNGRILVDPAAHTLTLHIPDEDTAAISWTWGVYDLLLTPPNGEALRLLRGDVEVDRAVTL